MTVMVPALARVRPAVSARAATETVAWTPEALTALAVVTQRFVGCPATLAIDPAGSVRPAPRTTERVTVP